jgi:hypothetical protein
MEEKSLLDRLNVYYCWLYEENTLKKATWQRKNEFIRDLPECDVEYAAPEYLEFANRQKEDKRNVKKAHGKVVRAWVWTALFSALLIFSLVSWIIDMETLLIIALPFGVFGALIAGCSAFSREGDYKYLRKTYAENVENMEKARLWVACEEKYTPLYNEAMEKAKAELEKFYQEEELDEELLEEIPKNRRNTEDLRKIIREVEAGAYTIYEALCNIKNKEREESEKYRICSSCIHYSKCKKIGTENCAAYFPL